MKQLLENKFSVAHGREPQKMYEECEIHSAGKFSCADVTACNECSNFFKSNCDSIVLQVESKTEVTQINFEYFIDKNFKKYTSSKCDFIFYDNGDKIVFGDFSCSFSEYIDSHVCNGEQKEGKRAKVQIQIKRSIEELYKVPEIAEYLDSHTKKIALFAYRAKDDELSHNLTSKLKASRDAFLGEFNALNKRKLKFQLTHDFIYTENRYPEVYKW